MSDLEHGYQLIEPRSLDVPAPAHQAAYAAVLRWFVERLQRELSARLEGVQLSVITANYLGEYPVIAVQYLRDVPDVAEAIERQVDDWVHGSEIGAFLGFLSRQDPSREELPNRRPEADPEDPARE